MGIKGLLPKVNSNISKSHVKDFAGRRVAIDGYAWLHKAAYSCARELCRGEPTDKWIYYILNQIDMFTFHNVHVTMVFDGADLPAKEVTGMYMYMCLSLSVCMSIYLSVCMHVGIYSYISLFTY